jgi:DNA-directed RNA polymerase subunit beta
VFDKDPGDRQQDHRTSKSRKFSSGEIPADDRERHVHHQRNRARDRIPAAIARPGVFFERQPAAGLLPGQDHPTAEAGWSFEYDNKNLLHVRIDRKRKFYGTVFLRALGLKTDAEILRAFYKCSDVVISGKKLQWKVTDALIGHKISHAISKGGETIATQGRKITASVFKEIQKAKVDHVEVAAERSRRSLRGCRRDRHGHRRSPHRSQPRADAHHYRQAHGSQDSSFEIFFPELDDVGNVISMTLRKDGVKQQNDALLEIYRKLRPGDPPTVDTATQLFQGCSSTPQVRFLARRAHEVQYQAA